VNNPCESARSRIEARRFIGWTGLPAGCSPASMFGVDPDEQWGELELGERFESARSRLLALSGYYRPMGFVRHGEVVLFDGMNPALDGGWPALRNDLGAPDATLDWVHGTVRMPAGELVHARRGITVLLNPENDVVIHVSVYVPTTVEEYVSRLRLSREKRPTPKDVP
jgi:hypothetical protein